MLKYFLSNSSRIQIKSFCGKRKLKRGSEFMPSVAFTQNEAKNPRNNSSVNDMTNWLLTDWQALWYRTFLVLLVLKSKKFNSLDFLFFRRQILNMGSLTRQNQVALVETLRWSSAEEYTELNEHLSLSTSNSSTVSFNQYFDFNDKWVSDTYTSQISQ